MGRNELLRRERRNPGSYLSWLAGDMFEAILMNQYLGANFISDGLLDGNQLRLVETRPLNEEEIPPGMLETSFRAPNGNLVRCYQGAWIYVYRPDGSLYSSFCLPSEKSREKIILRGDRENLIWVGSRIKNSPILTYDQLGNSVSSGVPAFEKYYDFFFDRNNQLQIYMKRLFCPGTLQMNPSWRVIITGAHWKQKYLTYDGHRTEIFLKRFRREGTYGLIIRNSAGSRVIPVPILYQPRDQRISRHQKYIRPRGLQIGSNGEIYLFILIRGVIHRYTYSYSFGEFSPEIDTDKGYTYQ